MSRLQLVEDCPDCRALGAELCPPCADAVRHAEAGLEPSPDGTLLGVQPPREGPGREAVEPPGHPDLSLREASVVLAYLRRYAAEQYVEAVAYAQEYLSRREPRPAPRLH